MADSDTKLDYKLALTVTTLRNSYPGMTVQQAHVFFLVALHEGKSLSEIGKLSNYPLPSISRKLADLGEANRKREPGLGLVETKVDPMELRRKGVFLTGKGRALMNDLRTIWRT